MIIYKSVMVKGNENIPADVFQELQLEKQKTSRAEGMMREQRVAMEKELNVIQTKSQTNYQELNNYQIKV